MNINTGSALARDSNLELEALDGTYAQRGARVIETSDSYEVSVDAFRDAPGVYYVKFPKENCSINCTGSRFESMSASMGSVFLQRRGADSLEHVAFVEGVSFALDRSSVTLQISKEKIRFSVSQILTYKLLERTQLSFPKVLK